MTWVLFILMWSGNTGANSQQVIGGFSSLEECQAAAVAIKKNEPLALHSRMACVSQRTNKGT